MGKPREILIKELLIKVTEDQQLSDYEYEIVSGKNKNDGFSSKIFHVQLTGRTKVNTTRTLNLIVKVIPIDEKLRTLVKDAFRREIFLYEIVVPLMEKLLVKKKLKNPKIEFIAKYYTSSLEDFNEAIVLENLTTDNFQLWNYTKPMNEEHIRLGLETYAQFHANSFALKHLDREAFDEAKKSVAKPLMAMDGSEVFLNSMKEQMEQVAKGLALLNNDELSKVFDEIRANLVQILLNESDNDEYFTFVHYDCWCNNFMFKYNDPSKRTPIDIKVLDWQLLWFGPPVTDFTYFFYANAPTEMFDRLEEFKDFYYDNFCNQLKLFDLDPEQVFPRIEFEKQMKKHAKFALLMSIFMYNLRLFKDQWKAQEELEGTDTNLYDQFSFGNKDLTHLFQMSNTLISHFHKYGLI